ncbi:MAG: hypothetical protein JEZ06_03680 [Anaerolineaceae bacterium]|nr:hypothetical protein [Anaerolineaceae bacterium]
MRISQKKLSNYEVFQKLNEARKHILIVVEHNVEQLALIGQQDDVDVWMAR